MTANFRNKISRQRPFGSNKDAEPDSDNRQPLSAAQLSALQLAFESDRGRIINSAAIRRLQQKTQVFPLERNAAVRSRLTHSLEVQQTGRFIVQQIFRELGDNASRYGLAGLNHQLESLVEMACLMHDIGNPPFGHLGEAAINRWFSRQLPSKRPLPVTAESTPAPPSPAADLLWQQVRTELCHYEGNAQGIRIVASLQAMNLTYSQSACILKYTRPAHLAKKDVPPAFSYLMKKPGFYLTEQAFVAAQNAALGISTHHRHPLAYIMEAADDISYCLADIEDAVEKGILSLSQVADLLKAQYGRYQQGKAEADWPLIVGLRGEGKHFAALVDAALSKSRRSRGQDAGESVYEFFIQLRVAFVHPLVQHAARQFVTHIDAVCDGSLNRALLEDGSPYQQITDTFKAVALSHVFSDREVELLEIQGFNIISGLLDVFAPLLALSQHDFALLIAGRGQKDFPLEQRLLHKLPKKYLQQYSRTLAAGLPAELAELTEQAPDRAADDQAALDTVWEFYLRCRLLQDHLGGMTDHFAADEYQALVQCR